MPIYHRKLLPESYSNQPINSSDCNPTTPYNCDYTSFYWPPDPPQLPPSSTITDDNYHISPYLIVIVSLIASAVLFISYYFIITRYCARLRQPVVNGQSRNFINEDHQPDVDHPIWHITTIGLQPSVINSITVVKFKKGDSLIESNNCSVCLSEFQDDENLRLLPKCNHAFHISCIDTWLRSHTNCPLCRAVIVSNESNVSSHGFGLNQNTQMENQENEDIMGLNNHVQESEVQDLKPEVESEVTLLRRSFSMDSAANVVVMDSNLSNSSIELQSVNHMRDSRTRRMMMMVRSSSYSGKPIM